MSQNCPKIHSSPKHGAYPDVWLIYPVTPLDKMGFSLASRCQLQIASCLGVGAHALQSPSTLTPSSVNLCKPFVCFSVLCEFIYGSEMLCVTDNFFGVAHHIGSWDSSTYIVLSSMETGVIKTSYLWLSVPKLTLCTFFYCESLLFTIYCKNKCL